MRVIPPLTITDAMLTSSSVVENDYAPWSSSTAYYIGNRVRVVSANYHHVFEALQDNTNINPASGASATWLDLGPTNRWKMFDLLRNTGTVGAASTETFVITPGQRVDSLALVGVDASSITVQVKHGATVVYSYSEDLSNRGTVSWFGYFFGRFSFKSAVALFDLPPYSDAVITVTVTKAGGVPTIGGLLVGMSVYLGITEIGAVDSALNFSKVDRDEFGNAELIPRRSVPKNTLTVWCEAENVKNARQLRSNLNAVPALWSGLDDENSHPFFEPVLILGFYKTFDIPLDHPTIVPIALELEEV